MSLFRFSLFFYPRRPLKIASVWLIKNNIQLISFKQFFDYHVLFTISKGRKAVGKNEVLCVFPSSSLQKKIFFFCLWNEKRTNERENEIFPSLRSFYLCVCACKFWLLFCQGEKHKKRVHFILPKYFSIFKRLLFSSILRGDKERGKGMTKSDSQVIGCVF